MLKDVSFSVKRGQVVGVVGGTGSGKSTIVSLIPRFYDPTAGRVLIDGTDVRDFELHPLRRQIGFVLQETVLFRGTIRDNIAYGRPGGATDEEIVAAAKLANADEFIAKMPKGYDTLVGERGDTLSGGQRQRIGIARAVIRDNPILILDEPTAALDTESERLVMEGLERLMKGRTVITIAHRLSTIRDADNIIVLAGGVVAEQGTHAQLLAQNGLYADLYHVQFGDAPRGPIRSLTSKRHVPHADRACPTPAPPRCSTPSRGAEDAARQDVRVLRSRAPRRRHRGEEARRRRARDAQPGTAQRRVRERGVPPQAGRGAACRCSTAIRPSTSRTRSRWSSTTRKRG